VTVLEAQDDFGILLVVVQLAELFWWRGHDELEGGWGMADVGQLLLQG
jgi:hypothetical protein